MTTIAIFCRYIDQQKPPFNTAYYTAAYIDLLLTLHNRGAKAYFVTNMASYKGNGQFTKGFTTDRVCEVKDLTEVGEFTADIVFNKGDFVADDVTILNPQSVENIASNKIETYKHFGKYQPLSFTCQNRQEVEAALQKLPGTNVVVKNPVDSGGHSVYIGSREEVLAKMPDIFPVIAQEFIDTSIGMEGLAVGMHDLRLMVGGGKIWGGRVRQPAPGEFRANIAQGGSEKYISLNDIPAEPARIALEIAKTFSGQPHYIAIDFAVTPHGWRLFELNGKPGLTAANTGPEAAHILNELADYLISLCQKTN